MSPPTITAIFMFIAHLPAGYILTAKIQKKYNTQKYLWLGLTAGILPDIDLLYFYLIDQRRTLHHDYWTHLPMFWLAAASVTFITILILKQKKWSVPALIFFGNIFLHLVLDTVVGKIDWLAPFYTGSFALFEVPKVYSNWILNFIFHWTFLFEIAILIWAFLVFKKTLRTKPAS